MMNEESNVNLEVDGMDIKTRAKESGNIYIVDDITLEQKILRPPCKSLVIGEFSLLVGLEVPLHLQHHFRLREQVNCCHREALRR